MAEEWFCQMKFKIHDETNDCDIELTVISFVNGIVIGVDESLTEDEELDNYEKIERQKIEASKSNERKKGRKNPEDNLGDAVATLNTAEIERGVDFENIFRSVGQTLEDKKIGYSEFFKDAELLANYCEYYNYTLLNFIRLFIEHKPEIMTVDFIKKHIKPMVFEMQKRKADFENEVEGCQYRRIFAHL
jgi:hypothetical protein